jgi:hypothetical protein
LQQTVAIARSALCWLERAPLLLEELEEIRDGTNSELDVE